MSLRLHLNECYSRSAGKVERTQKGNSCFDVANRDLKFFGRLSTMILMALQLLSESS